MMPTGYTDRVGRGEMTDFSEFAMSCARNFGALISMRDDPSDAEIPEEFLPSQYNASKAENAKEELSRIEKMSAIEADEGARKEHEDDLAAWNDRCSERKQRLLHYTAMLFESERWEPPTEEHKGLKEFMVAQLKESISFDCGGSHDKRPSPQSGEEWKENRIQSLRNDIAYHENAQREENERVSGRNKWVKDLRESLAKEQK